MVVGVASQCAAYSQLTHGHSCYEKRLGQPLVLDTEAANVYDQCYEHCEGQFYFAYDPLTGFCSCCNELDSANTIGHVVFQNRCHHCTSTRTTNPLRYLNGDCDASCGFGNPAAVTTEECTHSNQKCSGCKGCTGPGSAWETCTDAMMCTSSSTGGCDTCCVAPTPAPTGFPTDFPTLRVRDVILAETLASGTLAPTPYPTPLPTYGIHAARAAGDPHIERLDGTGFDIDASGTYDLLRVPAATGKDFVLKTAVGPGDAPKPGKPAAKEIYNRAAEFTGDWMGGHNFTVVGQQSDHGSGFYLDGDLTTFAVLLKQKAYVRKLSEYATIHAENCKFDDEQISDFCEIQKKQTSQKKKQKSTVQSKTTFLSVETPSFTATIHTVFHHGNMDVYVKPREGVELTNLGGLLAPQPKKRRMFQPELASSTDIDYQARDGEDNQPSPHSITIA